MKQGRGRKVGLAAVGLLMLFGIIGAQQKPQAPTAQLQVSPASRQSPDEHAADPGAASPEPAAPSGPEAGASATSPAPVTSPSAEHGSTADSNLSNDDSYVNVDGDTVHAPAYSTDDSVPAGATARCGDGTYSFSRNHSGTCSHHGGVAEWL